MNIAGISTATSIVVYGDGVNWTALRNLRSSPMTALENISLPNQTAGIPNDYFYNCTWLKSFSADNLTNSGSGIFYDCSSLQTISLPVATTIEQQMSKNCSSLQTVYLLKAQSFGMIVFENCTNAAGMDIYLLGESSISWESYYSYATFNGVPADRVTSHIKAGDELTKARQQNSYPYNNSFPRAIVEWIP